MVPNPEGLRALASGCDLVLCDIWGVLHNGVDVFIAAGDALRRFRETGGSVLLVSNAPRPAASVQRQLDGLVSQWILSTASSHRGDVTRDEIAKLSNRRLHHVGPERDLAIFAGLDVSLVDLAEADWVVCSGLVHDERETLDDYRERLHVMRQRGLGMICAIRISLFTAAHGGCIARVRLQNALKRSAAVAPAIESDRGAADCADPRSPDANVLQAYPLTAPAITPRRK